MFLTSRIHRLVILAAGAALLAPVAASAQSLRGSRASIDRMYSQARAQQFSFLQTPTAVRRFAASGILVPLKSGATYELHQVNFPYVRPATRSFVERLAMQYKAACGQRLVVTSAVRPATRQPYNSSERSVHPTGMAVDLRKPQSGRCLWWLRTALLELEKARVIEATEERRPPHFHVAVFPTAYTRYAAARPIAPAKRAPATATLHASATQPAAVETSGTLKPSGTLRASGTLQPSATIRASGTLKPSGTLRPSNSVIAPSIGGRAGAAPQPSAAEVTTYVVRRGDSLWRIARTHDTTVDAIADANDLDGHSIKAGQALQIPVGG